MPSERAQQDAEQTRKPEKVQTPELEATDVLKISKSTPPLTPQLAGWDDGSGGMNSSAGMQPQPVPPTPDKQVNFEDFAQFLVSSRAHLDR